MTIDWQVPFIVIGTIALIAFFIGRPKVEVDTEPEVALDPGASPAAAFAPDEASSEAEFATEAEARSEPESRSEAGFATEAESRSEAELGQEPEASADVDPEPALEPGPDPGLERLGKLSGPDLVDRIQHTLGIGILVESVEPTEPVTIMATFMSGQHTTRATVTGATEADAWQELAKAAVAWRNSNFQHLPMWWGGVG